MRSVGAVLAVALAALSAPVAGDLVSVKVPFGNVVGLSTPTGSLFHNIPYAQPALGALRWAEPRPWIDQYKGGAINGTVSNGAICPQLSGDVVGVEDCLFLSIYTPAGPLPAPGTLPVLFWIHGGAWTRGTKNDARWEGRVLATATHSVVVTVNYRLGALSHLALDELAAESPTGARGNYGTLDITEALRWTNANIAAFGGDKTRLSLFGQSAGGGYVVMLVSSTVARGLFRAAIAESAPGEIHRIPASRAMSIQFAKDVGCGEPSGRVECLRSLSVQQLLKADIGSLINKWAPVVDGVVLKGEVSENLASGDITRVPLLIGTNTNEAAYIVYGSYTEPVGKDQFADALAALEPDKIAANKTVFKQVLQVYPPTDGDNRQLLSDLESDLLWTCPARRYARAASKWVDVFTYRFFGLPNCSSRQGSNHGDEIGYIWQNEKAQCPLPKTKNDKRLGDQMQFHWLSMAIAGNPNEKALAESPAWPKFETGNNNFQALDPQGSHQIYGIRDSYCDFWDTVHL